MQIEYLLNGNHHRKRVSDWSEIASILEELDPNEMPYIVLGRENGDYMQIAGSHDHATVEARLHSAGKFKHFVMGHKEWENAWTEIKCAVGPIIVHQHEVLSVHDGLLLVSHFFENGTIHHDYQFRNVTRNFL